MRPGAETGVARAPDHLAALDPLAIANADAVVIQVGIQGHAAIVVQNAHKIGARAQIFQIVARPAKMPRRVHDHTTARSVYGCSLRRLKIHRMIAVAVAVALLAVKRLANQHLGASSNGRSVGFAGYMAGASAARLTAAGNAIRP